MISNSVLFSSTNLESPVVSFGEAMLKGIAPDRGLYMPTLIPRLHIDDISGFSCLSYPEIAVRVLKPFLCPDITEDKLFAMAKDAYNFDLPLEDAGDNLWIMRLDRGPTASFKDFAARMMARLMQHYVEVSDKELVILVATSGDTGSAIANAYHRLPGIKVVILFPKEEVSENQRRQMTTLGENIHVLAVDGKFDDCQRLVKEAFADTDLSTIMMSSANSINIGRLLPQAVYYFYTFSRLIPEKGETVLFAVPSGNFGNLMGGLIAKRMGLPIKRFIAATNSNDEFPAYLNSGTYKPVVPSINCISNAMNVGHPGNLARIISLYGGVMDHNGVIGKVPDMDLLREDIFSVSVSDDLTIKTISEYFHNRGILIEQHGAVSLAAVEEYRRLRPESKENEVTVVLETAHPAKFPDVLELATGLKPESPPSLSGLNGVEELMTPVNKSYEALKEYLTINFR